MFLTQGTLNGSYINHPIPYMQHFFGALTTRYSPENLVSFFLFDLIINCDNIHFKQIFPAMV